MEHRLDDLTMPRPAAASNLYVEVAQSLRSLIVERKLKPGDRLPSERVLAQQLQVGRPVVRDALRILETLGLIGVSPRQGSYVKQPDLAACLGAVVDSVARSQAAETGWQEGLWEARGILEAEGAALAAQRATPEDRRKVQEALERLRESLADGPAFREAEREFVRIMARAARNPILASLVDGVAGLCRNGAEEAEAPAAREATLRHYAGVTAAIGGGRPAEAREAMRRQLRDGEIGHATAA